jgi:hypothetical protein
MESNINLNKSTTEGITEEAPTVEAVTAEAHRPNNNDDVSCIPLPKSNDSGVPAK